MEDPGTHQEEHQTGFDTAPEKKEFLVALPLCLGLFLFGPLLDRVVVMLKSSRPYNLTYRGCAKFYRKLT